MLKNKLAFTGVLIFALFLLMAVAAPLIAPYDPEIQNLREGLAPPSKEHLMGQDKLGRDILSRIIYGSRVSIGIGLTVVSISLLLGIVIGAITGYFSGLVDEIFMRTADVLLAFPGLLLAIAFTAILGASLRNVVIALSLLGWVGYARIVRGQILSTKGLEYVMAARAIGASHSRIIIRHILPNIMAPVIVEATFGIAAAIIAEASLSFLGLGIQPPAPSWGSMLSDGRNFLLVAQHLTTYPGLAIMLLVMSLNFIGDGLRDYFDIRDQ